MTSTHLLARLVKECLHYPIRLTLAMISLIGLGGAQLALPWLVKRWVEGPLVDGGGDIGVLLSTALAAAGMVALFLFTSRLLLANVNQRMLERLRSGAVRRLIRTEPGTSQSLATGDVMSRVFQDAGMLSGFVELVLKRFLGDGILAIGALAMMFVLDPKLAAVACLMAPAIGLVLAAIGTVIRRWGGVAQREMGTLSGTLQEQLQGFTTIKSYLTEALEADRFSSHNASYRHKVVVAEGWSALLVSSVFLLAAIGFIAAVAFGTHRIETGAISAGGLLAFCLYAGQTVEPLRRLAEIHGHLQRSLAAAERLFVLFEMPITDEETALPPPMRRKRSAALRSDSTTSFSVTRRGCAFSTTSASTSSPAGGWRSSRRAAAGRAPWRLSWSVFSSPSKDEFSSPGSTPAIAPAPTSAAS